MNYYGSYDSVTDRSFSDFRDSLRRNVEVLAHEMMQVCLVDSTVVYVTT